MPAILYSDNAHETIVGRTNIQTITGQKTFLPASATVVGIIVRGAASQSANLQDWRNSGDGLLAAVTGSGVILSNVGFQGSGTAYLNMQSNRDPMVYLAPSTATSRPLVVRGAASQSANMFEIQDSTGAPKLAVAPSGALYNFRIVLQDEGSLRGVIHNPDTRGVNDAPGLFHQGVRWDFKADSTVGLPTTGGYNGLMSYSLWGDDSGGGVFQLAFGQANNAASSATGGGRTSGNIWMRYGTRAGGWQPWRPFNLADTSWAIIGNAGSPAFENGWTHYYSATQEPAGFRKMADGSVRLKGLLKSTSGGAGTVMFTLPVGYRPAHYMRFPIASGGFGRIDIGGAGQVYFQSGTTGEVDISSVSFYAEA